MLRGVLLDLDGVITDTATYHFKAWCSLAENYQLTLDPCLEGELKGVPRLDALKVILRNNGKLQSYSSKELIQLCEEKDRYYKSLIYNMNKEDILPGILDFLYDCKDHGIKLALASSSVNAPFILEKIELIRFFDTIVNPEEVRRGKPDPEIFLRAAQELALSVHNCIGIEDSSAGIEAINSAGIYSVGIGKSPELNQANLLLSDTQELSLQLFR